MLDLAYWGFRHWPFERTYAADRFFSSAIHEEAFARLLFLVEEHRRSGIVIGPGGTGKTYLLKLLQQRAERMGRLAVRCDATGFDGHELIAQIAIGCRVACEPDATPARVWSGLNARLAALNVIQQSVVIIIDHFDLVDFRCQQAICRLRQIADSIGVNLTLIVATRDRSVPTVLQDVLELRIELPAWDATETEQFIKAAIISAGSAEMLFTDEALTTVYELTKGFPASIISLCNLSLLAAMARGVTLITSEVVEAASGELNLRSPGYRPMPRLPDQHAVSQY